MLSLILRPHSLACPSHSSSYTQLELANFRSDQAPHHPTSVRTWLLPEPVNQSEPPFCAQANSSLTMLYHEVSSISMTYVRTEQHLYSLIIAIEPENIEHPPISNDEEQGARIDEIAVDWVDFVRDKGAGDVEAEGRATGERKQAMAAPEISQRSAGAQEPRRSVPGSAARTQVSNRSATASTTSNRKSPSSPSDLSLQPLLAHLPGSHSLTTDNQPRPLDASVASGVTQVGRGIVHLFRHAPPAALLASLDAHPVGEGSRSGAKVTASGTQSGPDYAGQQAEGEDGSLVAILAVPVWMRPADFLEFIGGWGTCLEGVRMIRYVDFFANVTGIIMSEQSHTGSGFRRRGQAYQAVKLLLPTAPTYCSNSATACKLPTSW